MTFATGRARRVAVHLAAAVAAAFWLGPYLWMVATSFKTLPEIMQMAL